MKVKAAIGLALVILLLGKASGQESQEKPSLYSSVRLHLSGYTQVLYSWWEDGVDSFQVRRARLSLTGEIMRKIRFKLQADAVKSPILVDAQVDFEFSSLFGLRIGQFYLPFGRENRTSSSDLETILRSQVVEKLAPSRDIGSMGRDIGAMAFGRYSFVEYMAGFFNGSGINKADNDDKKDFGARIVVEPFRSLAVGASLYRGEWSEASGSPSVSRHRTGVDARLLLDRISAQAEFVSGEDNITSKSGWYLQAAYFLSRKKVQVLLRFDSYDPDHGTASDRQNRLTLGVNWYLAEKTKLQVNYHNQETDGNGRTNSLLVQFQAWF